MCCQRKGKKSVLIICFVLIFCFSSKAHIKCILYFNHLPPVLHISLFMYACIDVVRNAYGKMFRYKDVCVLVQHFQCCQLTVWNLAIFLTLWFYVKSILADFRMSKTVVLTILEGLKFELLGISHLKMSKVSKNSKFRAAQMLKMAVFGASKWHKLISRKTWVAEKAWNFHIMYSRLGCPGL